MGKKNKACLFNLPKLKPAIFEAIQMKPSLRQSLKRGSMLRIFDYRLILEKVTPGYAAVSPVQKAYSSRESNSGPSVCQTDVITNYTTRTLSIRPQTFTYVHKEAWLVRLVSL